MKKQKNLTLCLKRIFILTAISLSFSKIKAPTPIACTNINSENSENEKNLKNFDKILPITKYKTSINMMKLEDINYNTDNNESNNDYESESNDSSANNSSNNNEENNPLEVKKNYEKKILEKMKNKSIRLDYLMNESRKYMQYIHKNRNQLKITNKKNNNDKEIQEIKNKLNNFKEKYESKIIPLTNELENRRLNLKTLLSKYKNKLENIDVNFLELGDSTTEKTLNNAKKLYEKINSYIELLKDISDKNGSNKFLKNYLKLHAINDFEKYFKNCEFLLKNNIKDLCASEDNLKTLYNKIVKDEYIKNISLDEIDEAEELKETYPEENIKNNLDKNNKNNLDKNNLISSEEKECLIKSINDSDTTLKLEDSLKKENDVIKSQNDIENCKNEINLLTSNFEDFQKIQKNNLKIRSINSLNNTNIKSYGFAQTNIPKKEINFKKTPTLTPNEKSAKSENSKILKKYNTPLKNKEKEKNIKNEKFIKTYAKKSKGQTFKTLNSLKGLY